jgi:hypothetical protein
VFIKKDPENETKDMSSSFHADVSGDERNPLCKVNLNHISLTILKNFSPHLSCEF